MNGRYPEDIPFQRQHTVHDPQCVPVLPQHSFSDRVIQPARQTHTRGMANKLIFFLAICHLEIHILIPFPCCRQYETLSYWFTQLFLQAKSNQEKTKKYMVLRHQRKPGNNIINPKKAFLTQSLIKLQAQLHRFLSASQNQPERITTQ